MNLRKILYFAIGPIGSTAIGFITLPLVTWIYTAEDVGRISMLQVATSFAILLLCLGLEQAYVREYHGTKNQPLLLKQTLLPGLFLIIILSATIFIFSPTLIANLLYNIESPMLSLVSIICIIASFLSMFLALVVRMEEKALAYSMSQLIPKILFLVFLLSILLFGIQPEFPSLILAHTIAITAVSIIFIWNTRKEWQSAIKQTIHVSDIAPLLKFGLPLVVGGLAAWGLNVMDKLFLRNFSTFSELGIYSVTAGIASAATLFTTIFNTIWAPTVYKWANQDTNLYQIDRISEYLLAVTYFIITLTGAFSWLLPLLLPREYQPVQYLIMVCILPPLLYSLSETTAIGITLSRKTQYLMIASISAMISNGIGNFLLVPNFGATGAAVSTAVSFYIFYILRTEFSKRLWRNIPHTKAYIIIMCLLITTLIHAFYFQEKIYANYIWGILFLGGFFIFSSSTRIAYNECSKIIKQLLKKI